MPTVNMLEAKTTLSKLVEAVESGAEKEIIIARNGKPAARLVPVETARKPIRLGLAKGKWAPTPEPDPKFDLEIERLFYGEDEDDAH
jgi:prevent-host-death family protein